MNRDELDEKTIEEKAFERSIQPTHEGYKYLRRMDEVIYQTVLDIRSEAERGGALEIEYK